MTETRNAYAILGIPFGSSKDAATRAFARRAKGQRHQKVAAESSRSLTELTWALNQVQENIREPETAVHVYRVPADSGALEPSGFGVLHPEPELMERTTGPSEEAWLQLLEGAREEALSFLHLQIRSTTTLPQR